MYQLLKQIYRVGIITEPAPEADEELRVLAVQLKESILKKFSRALAIRHVDAGSCNMCELEIQALNNPYYNIESLGIQFVASPRHADVLLVTGPVSKHMQTALIRTFDAMPNPKWVIAMGDCTGCHGIFKKSYVTYADISDVIPVNVRVPGCPPTPKQIMQGLLAVTN